MKGFWMAAISVVFLASAGLGVAGGVRYGYNGHGEYVPTGLGGD